jgi:hypothetical protein
MKYKLGNIAEIFYGPFHKVQFEGPVKYLVASHFNDLLQPSLFKDSYIQDDDDLERYMLKQGDLIFAGKGHRLFAWNYQQSFGKAVPSSLFYTIRISKPEIILSEYLGIFLNLDKTINKLKSLSMGTSIPSLQKSELSNLSIYIPPIDKQKQIIQLSNNLDENIKLTSQLFEKKKTLKKGLLNEIINNNI